MQKHHKLAIRGMLIGDSGLKRSGKNSATLQISHSGKQEAYFMHKHKYLEDAFGVTIPIKRFTTPLGYETIRLSFTHQYFHYCLQWLYAPKKKITLNYLRKISDEGVAFWYMDDGSLIAKKHKGKIHAYDLIISTCCSKEEAEDCILFFKERYDADFTLKLNKGLYSIRCGTRNARKLLSVIGEYIPECMQYKTFQQTGRT